MIFFILWVTFFLSKPGNEFLGGHRSHLLLLSGNGVKQISQAGQEGLLIPLVFGFVFQHLVSERFAKVEGLKN